MADGGYTGNDFAESVKAIIVAMSSSLNKAI
jgi:hypothetical protein